RKIPDNYPTRPSSCLGFYRESRTENDTQYVYLAEGVLELYKTSYRNKKTGQTRLVQGRQIALLPPEEMLKRGGFYSGHLSGHRFDFVKNRIDFIDEDYFKAYKYWISTITEYNDRPVYVISFDQEDQADKGKMKGQIFIDTLSYAFLRAEFEYRPEALQKYRNEYPQYTGRWKANKYIVQYQQFNNKWYLSEAVREGIWSDGGLYSNEFLVTELREKRAKPLLYRERMERNEMFLELTGEYDEDFWKQYNTSPLNGKLEETIRQLETKRKAEQVFDTEFMAKLQKRRDSMAVAESGSTIDKASYRIGSSFRPKAKKRKRKKPAGVRWRSGIGMNQLMTPATSLSVTYLDKVGQPIVSIDGQIESRDYEVFLPYDLDIFWNNWIIRWGISPEFFQNIYKEHSFGIGYEVPLSPRRPFFLRGFVQHSNLIYAHKLGQTDNAYGEFKVGRDKFKSDKINVYYGSENHNLKTSLELAVGLNPGMQLFVNAAYQVPFSRKRVIYLWERDRLWGFRRRARIEVDERVIVNQDDQPFNRRVTDYNTFIFTVGVLQRM
ncbi:MAG: hypothetical protein AAFV25_27500, partial [Bacteroidota bacterium]